MDTQRRWIGYDTFKLIVALVLLILLLALLLQKPAAAPVASVGEDSQVLEVAATQTPLPLVDTLAPPTSIPLLASPTPTVAAPTATLPPPTATPTAVPPTATPEAVTQPTPTPAPETAPQPTPTPETAVQPTPTEAPQAPDGSVDCPLAQPARLAAGQQALVITNLNLRGEAGMDKAVIRVSLPNSKVDVIGGPICIPYQDGAYLWRNIRLADGTVGWSAEASLSSDFYFLQPIP